MTENNVTRLAALAGSQAALARICDVTDPMIIRWRDGPGSIPWSYNRKIKAWALGAALDNGGQAWLGEVLACLSEPTCPTCGQPVDADRVL